MSNRETLKPATELARHDRTFPNDSDVYRKARLALLAEEIELRRHTERVAQQRRELPPGGEVPEDYLFQGDEGPIRLSQLFGDKDTLVTFNWMFGPDRKRPCPMCTSTLGGFDLGIPDLQQRVAFVAIASSPLERQLAFSRERGWRHIRFVSSAGNTFNRDYAFQKPGGEDNAAFNVFDKDADGTIRHTWGDEFDMSMADPGQDPRGPTEVQPLWTLLDMTPGGRGRDWYPMLEYGTPKGGAANVG